MSRRSGSYRWGTCWTRLRYTGRLLGIPGRSGRRSLTRLCRWGCRGSYRTTVKSSSEWTKMLLTAANWRGVYWSRFNLRNPGTTRGQTQPGNRWNRRREQSSPVDTPGETTHEGNASETPEPCPDHLPRWNLAVLVQR